MFKFRNTARNLAAIAALVFIAASPIANAQGRGGGNGGGKGGGGEGTAGGSIYFINGAGQGYSTNYMRSIDSDGSNVAQLGWYGYFQYPCSELHNDYRWYITVRQVDGFYPDGTTQRREVFAYRDDYNSTTNNNEYTKVQLTDDPTLEPVFEWFYGMGWHLDDQKISFKARRWSSTDPGAIDEAGLYMADLDYFDGNIDGLLAQPTLALAFPLYGSYSMDPTGTKVVYTGGGLWVADLSSGALTQLFSGGVSSPDWSPDGSKILFASGGAIHTIKPNGKGLKAVIRPTYIGSSYWSFGGHAYFSPTGDYITCTGNTSNMYYTNDVFSATSSGRSLTNLTNTPDLYQIAVGWR